MSEQILSNHEVTIFLCGGGVLGPFRVSWNKDSPSDVRELSLEYDAFLQGERQTRFKFHLHDSYTKTAHSLILDFKSVDAIYDQVILH